jgi:hypothetical protein
MAFVGRKGNPIYLVNKLVSSLRAFSLDLADLFPPLFLVCSSTGMAKEILIQLRLLHETFQVKLNQFHEGRARFSDNLSWDTRLARRRP